MNTIGAFDAKTHFSELLSKVRLGEAFTITHRNQPIATLQPINDRVEITNAIKALQNLSKTADLSQPIDLKALVEKGRR